MLHFQFLSYRLGRNESLDDIWIAGDFKPEKIACNQSAIEESKKLRERAEVFAQKSFFATDELIIGFLNACSLRKHAIDIDIDAELNKCHILGIAET